MGREKDKKLQKGSPLKRSIFSTSLAHKLSCLEFTVTCWSWPPLLHVQNYSILLTVVIQQHFRTSPSCSEQGDAKMFPQSPACTGQVTMDTGERWQQPAGLEPRGSKGNHTDLRRAQPASAASSAGFKEHFRQVKSKSQLPGVIRLGKYLTLGFHRLLGRLYQKLSGTATRAPQLEDRSLLADQTLTSKSLLKNLRGLAAW